MEASDSGGPTIKIKVRGTGWSRVGAYNILSICDESHLTLLHRKERNQVPGAPQYSLNFSVWATLFFFFFFSPSNF